MSEKTSYRLCCMSLGCEPRTINYYFLREFSKEEFTRHIEQIGALNRVEIEDRLYAAIIMNYDDLLGKVVFYRDYSGDDGSHYDYNTVYIDVNRIILNLFSSIRTYLDHTETKLKRKYGEDCSEIKLFKKLTADAFDTSFAYRFLAKLRNYAQHCGLPSGSFRGISSKQDRSLYLLLERDDLLKNFSNGWGQRVKNDLRAQPQTFDLLPLIDEKISLLGDINFEIAEMEYRKLCDDALELLDLVVETNHQKKGAVVLVEVTTKEEDTAPPQLLEHGIPLQAISRATGIEIKILPPYSSESKI